MKRLKRWLIAPIVFILSLFGKKSSAQAVAPMGCFLWAAVGFTFVGMFKHDFSTKTNPLGTMFNSSTSWGSHWGSHDSMSSSSINPQDRTPSEQADIDEKKHRNLKPLKIPGGPRGDYEDNPDVPKDVKRESDEEVEKTYNPPPDRKERRRNKRKRNDIEGNISGSTGGGTYSER